MGQITKVSPLAPATFPDLPIIKGVRFGTAAAGVKYQGRTDVMMAILDPGTAIAGVFTRSRTRAAPVLDCQEKIGGANDKGAAILVNSGNANAFTGSKGVEAVTAITKAVAETCDIPQSRIFTSSTGVIGEPLPFERVTAVIADVFGKVDEGGIASAAKAIMTTDTYAKGASATVEVDGKTVSIAGIAKGSGMIAPDMATMLVYIFTDAAIDQKSLQSLVSAQADTTFNCITVDSDTSTSDSLIVAATGASGVDVTGNAEFSGALERVMLDLAHQVVRDGEGATKFVEIAITGAASDSDAKVHGMAIANSPLIKTAIAGEDPNWGRVVMAIGKSGAEADRDKLSISFGDVEVAKDGWRSPNYSEEAAAAHMKGEDIRISVDLGIGTGAATVWTCDLTHGYIEINADYRS
ncbi:Arginine biosynthesis bifunctional protein ArgJ [Sulfitobacter noctilucicola]|uniref:Arginine biosynthesis bifunctional protein ArgJ n=1 Tax=Sulfitobacter noctilucicola TaxID=1342301 RepID=A0A7W6M5T9_9RHOB|nr:bifunctional glutamate N-acetyltransferase/amino-acid acetyltransferase ArgJ [Sulfitobacter noctilucicola]KIN62775.1 Arginine biosynthesis bifunctional protein ArgJ [Sulfitobacter noctilucicola]MBB4172692.1 glutamate N-acetyltransferase/amino-acid N-acetyltransferase [Sulfitobacter noctilucicola]